MSVERVTTLGALSPCPVCCAQPRLVERADGCRLECPPCGVRLWLRPTRQETVADWEAIPRPVEPVAESTEPRVAA